MIRERFNAFVDKQVGSDLGKRLDVELNEYGYDPWGFHIGTAKIALMITKFFYKHYFRVCTFGINNVPPGKVMLVANHSGQIPIDGMLIGTAMALESDPPRVVRSMVEYWAPTLPFVGTFFSRVGQTTGTPDNCLRILRKNYGILVFPEGAAGCGAVWSQRYKLQKFGTGFMRIALEAKVPIVPVAVIGGEEMVPSFWSARKVARYLGFPYVPITPTFPWAGPLGVIPYPTKFRLHFGPPIYIDGDPNDEDDVITEKIEFVKKVLQDMIDDGLQRRTHVFW